MVGAVDWRGGFGSDALDSAGAESPDGSNISSRIRDSIVRGSQVPLPAPVRQKDRRQKNRPRDETQIEHRSDELHTALSMFAPILATIRVD